MDIQKLYETYFSTVYKYIYSLSRDAHTAEEVTQETFFKALRHASDFRGDCRLSVWLCQIAKNCYLDELRKRKRQNPPGCIGDNGIHGRSGRPLYREGESPSDP